MFDHLFVRSDALTRQLSAPLVDERRRYLTHCAEQGMSRCMLRVKARLLLSITRYLNLADRPNDTINIQAIERAASQWSSHNWPSPNSPHARLSREYFVAQATGWLTFLDRFQIPSKPVRAYDQMLVEFRSFMEGERGLSPVTVEYRCRSVRPFLDRLLGTERTLDTITVADVDSLLAQKVNAERYARISVRGYASSLRSFFRYAEMRGWCTAGIATSIMAPRVFQYEMLPSGPSWHVENRVTEHSFSNYFSTIANGVSTRYEYQRPTRIVSRSSGTPTSRKIGRWRDIARSE